MIAILLGFMAVSLLTLPARPFLVAHHPIVLEFLAGSLTAVGTGAAYARIGQASLGLVIVAGAVGMVKLDWLFWLAGRRWGNRVLALVAPGPRAQKFVAKLQQRHPVLTGVAVAAAPLPGMPAAAIYCLAGLTRMRLLTFLTLNLLGSGLFVGLVAGLGYSLGQRGVDFILVVDKYAGWISIAIIGLLAFGGRQHVAARTSAVSSSDPSEKPDDSPADA